MTIEQIKQEVKNRSGKDITDEEAQVLLERLSNGELTEEDLEGVSGGNSDDYIPEDPRHRLAFIMARHEKNKKENLS